MFTRIKVWLVNHRFVNVRCTHDDIYGEDGRCNSRADSATYWDGTARYTCGYCRWEC